MIARIAAAAMTLSAAACTMPDAPPPAGTPMPIETASISYATQPCFGTCPVYRVTLTPDGQGVFDGQRHTAVTGERRFTVDAETAASFAEHLGAVKPTSGDRRIDMQSADCGVAPTDMPSIDVTWASNTGAAPQSLHLYVGCRSDEAQRVRAVLQSAPHLLPIAAFIGKSQ